MKTRIIFTLVAGLLLALPAFSTTVKLKITYRGAAVADSDITIKHGDAALGSGRTDGSGNVSISASSLISRSIDVYGSKTCGGAKKTWNVSGFVALNDDNFFHLKLEDVMAEMSGMGMSEEMLASAWGLTAGGCNDSPSSSSSGSTEKTSGSESNSSTPAVNPVDFAQMREEKLQMQRNGLENEIGMHQRRISKQTADLAGMRRDNESDLTIRRAEIDLAIEKLKKEKKELELERVVAKLDGPSLKRDRKKQIDARMDAIAVEIDALKDEDKSLKNEEKDARREERFEDMGKLELRKHLADKKMKRSNKKVKIKMVGSKSKKAELEAEIEELDQEIEKYQNRLDELKDEGEEEESEGGEESEEESDDESEEE